MAALVKQKQAVQAALQQQRNLSNLTNLQHQVSSKQAKKKQKKELEAEALRILHQRGIGAAQHVISRAPGSARPSHAAEPTAGAADDEDLDGFGDGLEEESYSVVSTADLEALGLRKHPDAIAECVSLSSVVAPKAVYKSRLPAHVLLGERVNLSGFELHHPSLLNIIQRGLQPNNVDAL